MRIGRASVVTGEVLREQHRRGEIDRAQLELDELQLVLLGDRARDVERRRIPLLDDDLTEPVPGLETLQRERVLQLLGSQRAVADQQLPERGPLIPEVAGRFHAPAYRQEGLHG